MRSQLLLLSIPIAAAIRKTGSSMHQMSDAFLFPRLTSDWTKISIILIVFKFQTLAATQFSSWDTCCPTQSRLHIQTQAISSLFCGYLPHGMYLGVGASRVISTPGGTDCQDFLNNWWVGCSKGSKNGILSINNAFCSWYHDPHCWCVGQDVQYSMITHTQGLAQLFNLLWHLTLWRLKPGTDKFNFRFKHGHDPLDPSMSISLLSSHQEKL